MFRRALIRTASLPARVPLRFVSSLDHETLPKLDNVRPASLSLDGAKLAALRAAAAGASALDAGAAVRAFMEAGAAASSDPAVVAPLYEAVVRHADALDARQAATAVYAAALLGLSGTRGVPALEKAVARTAGDLKDPKDYELAARGAYGLRLVRLALGPLKTAAARLAVPIQGDRVRHIPGKGEMSLWQAIEAHKREQPALSEDQKEVHKESEWTT